MFRTETPPITREGRREALMRQVFAQAHLRFVGNDQFTGEPMEFERWELDDIWYPIFGCGELDEGTGRFTRRYRRALVGVPRGMGKSVIACAILLSEASIDPVQNGQYGIVAADEDQARHVYEYLMAMIRTSDVLWKVWDVGKSEIRNHETNQVIRVFPNKESSLQSWHFNLCICDELHVYRDERVWNAVISGQKNVPNALTIGITTASSAREGFLWRLYRSIVEGRMRRIYCNWVGIDDGDDPHDRRCWDKVLVSPRVGREALEDQLDTLGWRDFVRYQLNQFPTDAREDPFVEDAHVSACEHVAASIDRSRWYTVGVDGATSGDDTAVVAAQQLGDGTWAVDEWVWHGMQSDYNDLADLLSELAHDTGRPTIVIDPNRMKMLKDWLWNNRGIDLFDFPQTPRAMAPASELARWAVRNHVVALEGRPEIASALRNAVAVESKAYGDRISSTSHGEGSRRIDAAVALAMAMSHYDGNADDHTPSCGTFVAWF